MSHRAFVFGAKNERAFPKTESAMLFERRHKTNDPVVLEKRRIPLDRFFHIGTAGVHDFAQAFQDRPGKRRRAFNVNVNAWVFPGNSIASCFRAAFATSWQR